MRIVISSGHGLYIRGASGYLDEVDEARRVVEQVADIAKAGDVDVITFHDNESRTQDENLRRIVDFHNAQKRDLDVSVHFNAYQDTSKAMGTECLYVTQDELAAEVSAAIAAAAALPNRGGKYRGDLFFLNNTDKPAILIEVCFVDSSFDAEHYRERFADICRAIAVTICDIEVPEPGPDPEPPVPEPSDVSRPTLRDGDYGSSVRLVQENLGITPLDGDFGPKTETAVKRFQADYGLDADGVIGPQTWAVLEQEFDLPPYPAPFLEPLSQETIDEIIDAASSSDVADLLWEDRGVAPLGYIQGMALAYATVARKYELGDLIAHEMAKADTGDTDTDALAYLRDDFQRLGMDNSKPGRRTLRHVFVLLTGLGMRESSGAYCCGRDQSAGESSQSSDTCEAGLFQASWNFHSCCTDIEELLEQYRPALDADRSPPQCQLMAFQQEVECSPEDWDNVGSGTGAQFQELSKICPAFAVESVAVGVRNIRQHWGPINRGEVQLSREANALFAEIDDILQAAEGEPPST